MLFVTDALRYDVIAVLCVLVLAGTGVLTPREAFAGFAEPAVVLIGSMYVFGRAVHRWGIAEAIAERLLRRGLVPGRRAERTLPVRVTAVSGVISSVISDTGVVATLIPVVSDLARKLRVPASRLLMPLAYGSLIGGLVTLIGTSTNVAINGVLQDLQASGAVVEPLGVFEFTHLGLLLLVVGCLYFASPFRRLLPTKRVEQTLAEHYQVPKFLTEVLVEPSSALIDRTVADAPYFEKHGVAVLGIVRAGTTDTVLAPGPYNRIRREDVLIVQGEPEAILALRQELGLAERPSVDVDGTRLDSGDVSLVEAVVPAGSSLVGATLVEADFRATTGLNVLAVSQHGRVQPTKIGRVRLDVGDTLLIQGHARDLDRVRRSRELLVLGEVATQPLGRGALTTVLLLALVLLLPALGVVHLAVAALAGAAALVLTGTVRPEEAKDSVDWSVLVLVGGMLSLGKAFHVTGLEQTTSDLLLGLGEVASSPRLLIALLLVATVVLTQLTTNVTAGVIMTPIAVDAAAAGGFQDATAFVMAVLTGASFSFMSPVAHQANAMVVGPGDYRFRDFLRVGTPLTLILVAVDVVALPWLWPVQL
ncbi:MAG TPA: SLC13 family permease [Planctomycetota bacterium]|nr:SLC13 family permease [Planctomycetota bacterium]